MLRAENELLQESMDCLRKELDEARSDAKGLTQELKSHNIRAVSSMNDLTIEMTVDGSSECAKRRDSILPWFVEGEDIMGVSIGYNTIQWYRNRRRRYL